MSVTLGLHHCWLSIVCLFNEYNLLSLTLGNFPVENLILSFLLFYEKFYLQVANAVRQEDNLEIPDLVLIAGAKQGQTNN